MTFFQRLYILVYIIVITEAVFSFLIDPDSKPSLKYAYN